MATDSAAPNLWNYVMPQEAEHLRDLERAETAARAEVQRIASKIEELDRTLTLSAASRYRNTLAAAARALGEASPVTESLPPPVDRAELEEALAGLRERRVMAEDTLSRQRGAFRSATIDLVRTICRERIAPEYARVVEQAGAVFAMYQAAETLLLQITPLAAHTSVQHIAPDGGWIRMRLPGARPSEIPELAKISHDEMGDPVAFGGEYAARRGVGSAALARFKESVTKSVGRWPFER